MLTKVVDYVKDFFSRLAREGQEVTVVFVQLSTQEWMAYIDEMPAVNAVGSSPATALEGVMSELKQYGLGTQRYIITHIGQIKYWRPQLPE